MNNYYSIITKAGLNKIIKASANTQNIVLTQMGISDFEGEITQDIETLSSEKHRFNIASISASPTDPNVLICEGVIASDIGGFYVRKVGIYTDDGVLFALGSLPPSYKPLLSEGSAKDITIKFYMQVDSSANITLKVDNSVVIASRSHVENELKKLEKSLDTKFLSIQASAQDSLKLGGRDADEYMLKREGDALLQRKSDGLKIGSYLLWSSDSQMPAGFLLCDGRSLKKSEYKELFNVIGYTYGGGGEDFNIPKFNDGRFMRSTGGNAKPLGEVQEDAMADFGDFTVLNGGKGGYDFLDYYHVGGSPIGGIGAVILSEVTKTANENRPFNMSMTILIKAKEVRESSVNEIDNTLYATEAKAGIVKISHTIQGNAQDTAVSQKGIKDAMPFTPWQKQDKKPNIVYTNTQARAIMVNIITSTPNGAIALFVDDIQVSRFLSTGTGHTKTLSAIIPPSSTYKFIFDGAQSEYTWLES